MAELSRLRDEVVRIDRAFLVATASIEVDEDEPKQDLIAESDALHASDPAPTRAHPEREDDEDRQELDRE